MRRGYHIKSSLLVDFWRVSRLCASACCLGSMNASKLTSRHTAGTAMPPSCAMQGAFLKKFAFPGAFAPPRGLHAVQAFTLLELLTVIAIICILMALVIPAVGSIGRANNLTVATQNFIAQINRARQEALTRNRSVEFQLLSATREAGETAAYRAMRYIICDETGLSSGSNAFTNKTMWFPQAVVISTNTSLSVFSPTLTQTNNVALPGGITATGLFFRIRPNGMITTAASTTPDTLKWTLTAENGGTNNFSTIQIDTRTGITRLFRP